MGFEKYSNYNENAGVSSVVFGSDKPVLEVELNEVQEIQNTVLRRTIKNLLGDGITDKSAINYIDGSLVISDACAFVVDGLLIQCTGLSIPITKGTVYLQVWEEVEDFNSTLKKEGNQQSTDSVTNYMKDSRFPVETSRRKVIKYTLSTTEDSTKHNLAIANVADGHISQRVIDEVNLTKLSDKVIDLQMQIGNYGEGVFGVEVDLDNNTVKRVGNNEFSSAGSDYDNSPIWGNRKRCNVTDDGVVVAFYGDTAYTERGKLITNVVGTNGVTYPAGTDVQCMVMQPKFYYKRIPIRISAQVDNTYTVKGYNIHKWIDLISPIPRLGFKLHPAFKKGNTELDYYFIGENEGCIQSPNGNYDLKDEAFLPVSPYTDYKFSSIAGAKPVSGAPTSAGVARALTRSAVRQLCLNRGANWQQLDITIVSAEQMLFLIEYAKFNMQETPIGIGVTSLPFTNDINDSAINPDNNILGNGSGIISVDYTNSNGTSYTTVRVPVYRGVKNPFGNIWKFIDGFLRNHTSSTSANEVYWQDGSATFGDDFMTNHKSSGFSCCTADGYIKAFGYTEACDFMYIPSLVGGDSSKPVGDYCWVNMDTTTAYIALLGSGWYSTVDAGLFCYGLQENKNTYSFFIGGRLCRKSKNVVFAV